MSRFAMAAVMAFALGGALGPPAAEPAYGQSAPGEAADTMFWDSVKNSKDPDEVRAYLDKFPNGMFAPLARIRLKNLEAARGAPSSSQTTSTAQPRLPSSTASALTSPSAIREVQDRLYNLNYQVGARSGRITEDTRKAIRQWQENVKQPITGDITETQLALLRRARVPTTWGAIAYFAKGASATIWNRPTRAAAESDSLAACRKNAGGTCSVVTAADRGCAALGFYNAVVGGKQYWGAYAIVRPTLGQATDGALAECRQRAKQPNACGVRASVCADGGHRR